MAEEPRSRLGRGLAALIGEISETPEPAVRPGRRAVAHRAVCPSSMSAQPAQSASGLR